MQKFNGSLIRQFSSLTTGNAASGVQVSVFISGTNTLATIYATNNTAGAQLDNPLTTDDKGFYSFYAVDGRYRLQFNNGFPALEEQLVDVIDINAQADAAIAELGDVVDSLTVVVAGDFETGTTVTARNQVVLWPTSAGGDGREYRWAGALPKTVPAASTPAGTGGISDSAWVYTADVALEQSLAEADSAKLVGGVRAGDLSKYTTAIGDCQRFVQKLRFNKNADMVVMSDSTGDATNEWVYQTALKLADQYHTHTVRYRLWDNVAGNYATPDVIQTGSGSAILTIWNAAIAGSIATRFVGDQLAAAVRPGTIGGDPDLVFVSYGHNGGNVLERQYSMHSTLIAEVSRLLPVTPIVIIGQNPVTTDDSMTEKVNLFKQIAKDRGCGFIDVHSYFLDNLQPLADFYIDDVHPNAAGSLAWAELVFSALQYSLKGSGGPSVSAFNGKILTVDTAYQISKKQSVINNVVLATNTTEFETRGESLSVTGNGGASPFAVFELISSDDILKYRNRYVNANVRIKVPAGSSLLTGRVAMFDGTTTITSTNGGPFGDNFYSQVMSIKVDAAATYVRLYVYVDAAAPTEVVYIDRITLSDGLAPFDGRSIVDLDIEAMTLIGNSAIGLARLQNKNNNANLLQIMNSAAADNDDPATKYTASLSANGLAVKQKDDVNPRIFTAPDGSLYFGFGTEAANVRLQVTSANLMRLLNAHFYSQDNNLYDLGIAGKAWRKVFTNEVTLGNSTVRWLTGAGTPEGAITAPIGSMYTRTDGGAGTTLYVKESGTGNTGWVAK